MKRVLFNLELIDRYYCFYLDTDENKIKAFSYKRNASSYFVNKTSEIDFLNRIICKLNNRYIKVFKVFYNNEYYTRYVNRFSKLSYFTREDGEKETVCKYEDFSTLYDRFNIPLPMYAFKKKNLNKNRNRFDYESDFDSFYDLKFQNDFENTNFGNGSPYSYNPPQNRKKGNALPKILIAVAGSIGIITLSGFGIYFLHNNDIPFLSKEEQAIEETFKREDESTKSPKKIKETKVDASTGTLETDFGIVDIVPDDEEEKALKEKYSYVEEQLKDAGLKEWEISSELDKLSIFQGDNQNISFYYDADKDEVIYVYENLERENSDNDKENAENVKVPKSVENILNAITTNQNLSDDEKRCIIEFYLDTWIRDSEFIEMNQDEIAEKYHKLKINYEKKEDGSDLESREDYPYKKIDGYYQYSKGYIEEERRVRNIR